jgi:translocation and assembly module TamB
MRRVIAHAVFVTLLSTLATIIGVVSSMTATRPGRHLLARIASEELAGVIRGHLTVREISGSFLGGLVLDDVVIRDTLGGHLATIPTVEVTYRLPLLLAGQVVLNSVRLESPDVELRVLPSGRLNLKEVFRLGEGSGTGPSPLIQFRNVRINDGRVRVETRWTPNDTVTTAAGVRAALARERAKLGRVIEETSDGFLKVVTIEALTARLRQVTASSPDGQPLTIDIDSLHANISDPQVSFRHAIGRVQVPGDSLIFSLDHAALPRSEVLGGGVVVFREGTEFFDFTLVSSRAALWDFLWVSTDFPDMAGATLFAARTESTDRAAFVLRDLSLTGPDGSRLEGDITVVQDDRRGLGFRDVDVTTERVDLDAIRPFLDTIPFYGTVTGRTTMDGHFDALAIGADWVFVDTTNDSLPVSVVLADGVIHVDDTLGLVFDSVDVVDTDIDLRTVRRLAPAVILEGRLEADGVLRGPLRNAALTGNLLHRDGDGPESIARGFFRLDTRRDTLAIDVNATLDPLDFEGIRRGFPGLESRGRLQGHVAMVGPVTAVVIDAEVTGDLGAVSIQGTASLLPEALGGAPVTAVFTDLDLASLLGTVHSTRLNGTATLDGQFDAVSGPAGGLSARLTGSTVREFPFDTLMLDVGVTDDDVIVLDTLHAEWHSGGLGGSGTLGWRSPATGTMAFTLGTDSLGVLDTMVVNALGLERDTIAWRDLDGLLEARLDLTGAVDALGAIGRVTMLDVALGQAQVDIVRGTVVWSGGDEESLSITARMDTVRIATYDFPAVTVALQGRRDSLAWGGTVGMGHGTEVTVRGRRMVEPGLEVWRIDTVAAYLIDKSWDMQVPSVVTLTDSAVTFTGANLAARDGSGFVRITPFGSGDEFELEALGVGIRDLYGVLQRDTTNVGGSLAANLILGGTREAPQITGTVQVADATLTDFRAPLGRAVIRYRDRTLDAAMLLWRTGQPVLRVDAQLPVDLALARVADRRIDQPLYVRMVADSVDLGVFDAFTASVDDLRGLMVADVQIQGTWDEPSLSGFIDIADARGQIEGLGVEFRNVVSRAHLVGDSILIDTLGVQGADGGGMDVTGWVRMEALASPILNLDIVAQDLLVIDAPEFLTLAASGRLHLEGPLAQPVLTGSGSANRGVLYFADLVNKQVLNLEDPDNTGLVDLSYIRERRLGSRFQNRFIDSLRIVDLDLDVQDEFYLRSNEANILLEGDLRVNKAFREYRLAGELRTIRGRYQLRIGIVTRSFEVQRGTVRYFGTPDLDAQLDITAEHRINPVDRSDPITVVATITGTMRSPRLQLTNRDGPPISQSDLVSYLMFGKPAFDLSGGQNQTSEEGALAWGLTALSSALSSEVERTLISDIGLPIDYLQIRPGSTPIAGSSVTSTRISAGWTLTPRLFITLSAGFCPNDQLLNYKALGASLEWRFSRQWRSSVSLAPSEACELSPSAIRPTRYQIGVDLLWEREF